MTDLSEEITIGKITFDRDRFLLPKNQTVTIGEIASLDINPAVFLLSTLIIRTKDGGRVTAQFPAKYNGEMRGLIDAVMSRVYDLSESGKNE